MRSKRIHATLFILVNDILFNDQFFPKAIPLVFLVILEIALTEEFRLRADRGEVAVVLELQQTERRDSRVLTFHVSILKSNIRWEDSKAKLRQHPQIVSVFPAGWRRVDRTVTPGAGASILLMNEETSVPVLATSEFGEIGAWFCFVMLVDLLFLPFLVFGVNESTLNGSMCTI